MPQRAIIPIVHPPVTKAVVVGGHRVLMTIWSLEQWARLRESERPNDAVPIEGIGWLHLRSG